MHNCKNISSKLLSVFSWLIILYITKPLWNCYTAGIELQHVRKLPDTGDTVDATGIQDEAVPSSDHGDIDLPLSPTADTTVNEGLVIDLSCYNYLVIH